MHIHIHYIGQVPKDPLALDTIEDSFGVDAQRGIIVISDGASESYDSRTLSKLICRKYLHSQIINQTWIQQLLLDFSSTVDISSLSWSKEAAYKRGSYATLLALKKSYSKDKVNIIGVGDSVAVLIDGKKIIDSFPYKKSSQFSQRPKLISTILDHNSFIKKSSFSKIYKYKFELSNIQNPIILCMTDALGAWVLRNYEEGNSKWIKLLDIKEEPELLALVEYEWDNKEMRRDDITLIKATFTQ